MTRPACGHCGKPTPEERCPGCGRPRGVQAAGERLVKYLKRTFADDPGAVVEIETAFAVMQDPTRGACANPLEAMLALCKEAVATWGGPHESQP
jgi:hypothetical protein